MWFQASRTNLGSLPLPVEGPARAAKLEGILARYRGFTQQPPRILTLRKVLTEWMARSKGGGSPLNEDSTALRRSQWRAASATFRVTDRTRLLKVRMAP